MIEKVSNKIRHFFHVVSNIRPIFWIGLYIAITPVFALIYWALPDGQFRIPDNAGTDFGSWLYYSIVTITTLGFGDYTPAHGWAQAITAIEVVCGLSIFGFFLNAVGSMKSEIDVESEVVKQKQAHFEMEKRKLLLTIPSIIHNLNIFLSYCYALTTPVDRRSDDQPQYNPEFQFNDMADLFKPSGLSFDNTRLPAVARFVKSAAQTSLNLDSLQTKVDLTLWPDILEECFAFVANFQMFSATDVLSQKADALLSEGEDLTADKAEAKVATQIANWTGPVDVKKEQNLQPVIELYFFIKDNAALARKLETALTKIANS
jgi:hypothetical protein